MEMALPRDEPVLCGRADGERERRVGVAVAVAVVVVPAAVARGPHEDAALALAARRDALHERARRQPPGAVHRLAVIVGAPAEKVRGSFVTQKSEIVCLLLSLLGKKISVLPGCQMLFKSIIPNPNPANSVSGLF